MSASIGLDDPTVWDRTAVHNLALALNATLNTGNAYACGVTSDGSGRGEGGYLASPRTVRMVFPAIALTDH